MTLDVALPKNGFYSLYVEGGFFARSFDRRTPVFHFAENAALVLYYTYPAYREAAVIRNTPAGAVSFPGLSKKVSVLFSVRASRVDKLRRASSFLKQRFGSACSFSDAFYARLCFLLQQKGRLNYAALRTLAENAPH
jgi:hypothetical protein